MSLQKHWHLLVARERTRAGLLSTANRTKSPVDLQWRRVLRRWLVMHNTQALNPGDRDDTLVDPVGL